VRIASKPEHVKVFSWTVPSERRDDGTALGTQSSRLLVLAPG